MFVEMIPGQPIFAGTSGAREQLVKIQAVSTIHPEKKRSVASVPYLILKS